MNETLQQIKVNLDVIHNGLSSVMPSNAPMNTAHGNAFFPGLTRADLEGAAVDLISYIEGYGDGDVPEEIETQLIPYIQSLSFCQSNTVPQMRNGQANLAITSYIQTMNSLRKILESLIDPSGKKQLDESKVAIKNLNDAKDKIRGLEALLNAVEPKAKRLEDMVNRIEEADKAAHQLPTNMQDLSESRANVKTLLENSIADREKIANLLLQIQKAHEDMLKMKEAASTIVELCDEATRKNTSQGLGGAFNRRALGLNISLYSWLAVLFVALVIGAIFGHKQLEQLSVLLKDPNVAHDGMLWVTTILGLMSIGAPLWMAWIATKQIGHRFRLAEDYSYKAAISHAYEGYRREGERFSKETQERLFSTVLTKIDEAPLRLVETNTHGSPWHEAVDKLSTSPLSEGKSLRSLEPSE